MKDISTASFVKFDLANPQDLSHTDTLDLSRPRIIILGGENTYSCNWAYNYGITIAKTLYNNKITRGLDIYSVHYKFRDRDVGLDRLNLFREFRGDNGIGVYGTSISARDIDKMNLSYPLWNTFPNYIKEIFEFAFVPLMYGRNHQLLPIKKLQENFRNQIIWTHCHGAYVLRMIEKYMLDESYKYTKSPTQMQDMQKNIVAINHAPFAPLEDCNFTAVSFCSASDTQISFYNPLSFHMRVLPNVFQAAFFGPEFGNIMVTDRIKKDGDKEHSQVGLSGGEDVADDLMSGGKILFATERNALLAATYAMLTNNPIPTIPEMMQSHLADFNQLKSHGGRICRELGIKSK